MRIKAGNQLSDDAAVLDFGSGYSLNQTDRHVTVSNGGSISSASALAQALGVQFEPFPAVLAANSNAPNTQIVWGTVCGVTPGATLTGVQFRNAVAAAGTLPTTVRFGIADVTGKMLAVSANANALASWGIGANAIPFTAPYTIPAGTTALIPCFVVNGTWGTTQPTPIQAATTTPAQNAAYSTFPPPCFQWTGQTDLPAVGSSLTLSSASSRAYYLSLY